MRLHTLEMTAFGPFADTTVVDFDALGADGLFLLHGRTGAGKTTVLDAIAFALYGRVPGARAEGKRLHSDHASKTTPPLVVLEATMGGRRLRLTRSPEFARPKRDGTGMRTIPAKATLAWLDGHGENLARITDIGEEVLRLLGMSADQFFQVVLLPQGDFARFLRADNEDREKLLEKLFDTARFGAAEQWLADRRRAARADLDARTDGIERLIIQVGAAAGVSDAVGAAESTTWSQHLLSAARADLETAVADVDRCQQAVTRTREQAERQRRLNELHTRATTARRQLDEHAAGAQRRTALRVELDLARRAEEVGAAIDEARTAVRTMQRADGEERDAVQRLAARLAQPASAGLGGSELLEPGAHTQVRADADVDAAIQRWSGQIGGLDEMRADADSATRIDGDLRALHSEDAALDTRIRQLTARREQLPDALATADADLREATEAAAALPGLNADVERLQTIATAAVELAMCRETFDQARAEFDAARSAHLTAKERVLDLRERRLAGMAAELAGELVDDAPCAVCGSVEHPARARPAATAVSEHQEQQAAAAERSAEADWDRARARIAELERTIEVLVARGGDTDRVAVAAALRAATVRYDDSAALADQADGLAIELARLRTDEARLHEELRECASRRAAAAATIASLQMRRTELTERLAAAAGADETIDRRRSRLTASITEATAVRDVRAQAKTAREQVSILADRVAELTAAAGMAPEPDVSGADDVATDAVARVRACATVVTAASRTAQRQDEIDAELVSADRARAHAEAVLAEPEIQAVAAFEPGDPAELDAHVATAQAALNTAVAAHAEAGTRVDRLEELSSQLWAAVDRIAPVAHAFDELNSLADVVAGRGANNRRMSLHSYALAARLEEVAQAGSVRLRRMSGGRYEFVHSDAAGPRGRRGGLGLDIRDDYTGAVRPAHTLSGGETFMAALSLALGLADTVAAESGGIMLDTLFIDEGFGGLDPDSLDAVMGVLDDLRAGGRVVGVVSHVDEMRQRIPNRLHVVRGRAGSHLRASVT
ncbi:AAA family ATPase [Nocardia sp. CNY236]|uniref:AAA family ATPase n=1 Tax=Nocardia sp. CNY236 TaxID=1169152 RepID=UPI00041D6553|nr:AAA family ATPase [Nocardia sp. CNY236]